MDHLTTYAQLVDDLRILGLEDGDIVMVHCRLSSFGWVPGGEQAVKEALRAVVGLRGTIAMPTQSWQLCDPAYLNHPSLPRG